MPQEVGAYDKFKRKVGWQSDKPYYTSPSGVEERWDATTASTKRSINPKVAQRRIKPDLTVEFAISKGARPYSKSQRGKRRAMKR